MASPLIAMVLAACNLTEATERRVEAARGTGETQIFDIAPRYPLKWLNDDVVVFLTGNGTATIDLRTGAVTDRPDPTLVPPNPSPERTGSFELPPHAKYGPWTVQGNGLSLKADDSGDVYCGALLVSPDEDSVACNYIVTDRMAESNSGRAAVIRLR
ncbi:MAG: hypothetical protein IT195_07770 [Microthrixaceae bacterium]|nr:hypothetical protein [Microthrixaceae bacterium]